MPSTPEVIGVAAGLASLGVAFYAIKISLGSLRIAEEQHRVFLRNLNAHADFELRITPPGADGLIETTVSRLRIVWSIGIENTGDKAARHVHVAFVVPRFLSDLRWKEGKHESSFSKKGGPHLVREDLADTTGTTYKAQAVTKSTDYVGRTSRFAKASAILELPDVGDEIRVPVKLLTSSDDLPEDVESVTAENEILVRRVAPLPTATKS